MAVASRLALAGVVLGGVVGCSSTGAPDDVGAPSLTGRQAFVVSSTLPEVTGSSYGPPPKSHIFTLALDLDQQAGSAIVGWRGGGVLAPFTRSEGGFRLLGPLKIAIPGGGCGDYILYDGLSFRFVSGGTQGASATVAGEGHATLRWVVQGDLLNEAAVEVQAAGVADEEPPTLDFTATQDITDPLLPFTVTASEPLATDAHLSLVSARGERLDLAPSGSGNFVSGFLGPSQLLRYGEQYQLVVDGAVDLAGNIAIAGGQFTTHPMPPLIGEDGFESSPALGDGLARLVDSRVGPPIAGETSLYVPPGVAPEVSTHLVLRLAVAPSDRVVRFSYRTVHTNYTTDRASYRVFTAEGDMSTWAVPPDGVEPTPAQIGAEDVYLGPIETAEIPLPAGAAGEVYFARTTETLTFNCFVAGYPATGIMIDDLRVE